MYVEYYVCMYVCMYVYVCLHMLCIHTYMYAYIDTHTFCVLAAALLISLHAKGWHAKAEDGPKPLAPVLVEDQKKLLAVGWLSSGH